MTRSTEKGTQRAILDFLELSGVFHWRNNTGAYKTDQGAYVRYGQKGSPDIFAVLPPTGQLIGIEVKDVNGKLSASQEQYRDALISAGGLYIVAKSLDDVMPLFGKKKWAYMPTADRRDNTEISA